MRELSAAFAAHLALGATTLATCWIVSRTDGTSYGFTDHDRTLTIDGTACAPETGFDRSAASRASTLAAGEEEIVGALSSAAIDAGDLAAGLWDGATVAIYRVNWQAPEERLLLRSATLGEVTVTDGAFRAELRGPAARLDRSSGRLFSRFCDAAFGDSRCGAALASYRVAATVGAGATLRVIPATGIAAYDAGWFTGGSLAFADGTTATIASHLDDAAGIRLILRHDLAAAPAAGTAVTLTAGCDKRFETCRDRFANHENFRGFPHMPGQDFVFSYARGDGEDDGEVLF